MVARVALVIGAGSSTGIGFVTRQSIVVDGGNTIQEIKGA
jgi:hypothetical protein